MKVKKVLLLLLTVTMLAGGVLTGCGNSTQDTSTDGNDTTVESVDKIVVFQSKVEIQDQLESLAKTYEEETGIEVEVWGTTGDDYFQQLKIKLGSDEGPTIFSASPGAEAAQIEAYEADLSDVSFVDKIADGMAYTSNGKTYGIPYTVEGFGLAYNKDLLDASTITDTDSFIKMMEDSKAQGVNGFGLSQESYFLIGHILNTPFAVQADPNQCLEDIIAGKVEMKDIEAFQEFAKIYESVRDNSYNPLEANYDKECGDFATGKTASIHQGNWCASMFEDYDIDFEMGMAALPITGNDKLAVSVPTAWFVNSQASEEEIQAGKDFLSWLYTSETGIDYLMNEFGFIPVVEGMENQNLNSLSQSVADFTQQGNTIGWSTNYWPAGIVDVYLVPVAEEFFTTDMSTDEFLEKLNEAFVTAGNK